jgi:exopolysaccharide biosynthesis predicted pyruvyltransferase EpsI
MPGNIGDHLIWLGTERLLGLENVSYTNISVTEVKSRITSFTQNATLIVPGSGALTSLFNEWLPETIEQASKLYERVVILPSEYEPNVPSVQRALERSNVFSFAREAVSYGKIKVYGKAALSLDPALWAFDFVHETKKDVGDNNPGAVLLALRSDSASLLLQSGLRPSNSNDDISISKTSLSEFISSIQQADTIVSDRLHVVVAAVMLGKSVRFIDPYNEKISRYVRYNFEDRFSHRLQQRDEKWLVQIGLAEVIESQS